MKTSTFEYELSRYNGELTDREVEIAKHFYYNGQLSITKEEGDLCQIDGCDGVLEFTRVDPCSCHENPPCQACVEAPLLCNKCNEEHTPTDA